MWSASDASPGLFDLDIVLFLTLHKLHNTEMTQKAEEGGGQGEGERGSWKQGAGERWGGVGWCISIHDKQVPRVLFQHLFFLFPLKVFLSFSIFIICDVFFFLSLSGVAFF